MGLCQKSRITQLSLIIVECNAHVRYPQCHSCTDNERNRRTLKRRESPFKMELIKLNAQRIATRKIKILNYNRTKLDYLRGIVHLNRRLQKMPLFYEKQHKPFIKKLSKIHEFYKNWHLFQISDRINAKREITLR